MNATILVIEDEREIRKLLRTTLEVSGFASVEAENARDGRMAIVSARPDLVILDLGLPDQDGRDFLADLREWSKVPVIVLSAREREAEKVAALENGADDYVTKPFDLRELKARIRAVLRRGAARPAGTAGAGSAQQEPGAVPFGRVTVDRAGRRLLRPDGTEEAVTAMEFDLIETFLDNPYRVLSRDRLLDLAHRRNDDPFDRSIDIRITRLRKKIEEDPSKPQTIKTVRGAGYIYSPVRRT